MIRKQSTDHVLDQVSVPLLDASQLNINQKNAFFKKTLLTLWFYVVDIVRYLYFLEYPKFKFLKIIEVETVQIPGKISYNEQF